MAFLLWSGGVVGAAVVAAASLLLAINASLSSGATLAFAAAGITALVIAAVQARRDRGVVPQRHCLECGTTVAPTAGFCPRCNSVRLEEPGGSAPSGRGARSGRDMPVGAFSSDRSGVIGWVDTAPPGLMGESADAIKNLRRIGIALLGLATFAAVLGSLTGR